MVNSVESLLETCGLTHDGVVRWGEPIPEKRPGVYLVSSSKNPSDGTGSMTSYLPALGQLSKLKSRHESLSVDGRIASIDQVANRLSRFWIPNVPVLYVGLAGTSLQERIRQYYSTEIGHRSPHSGGWWLKTLDGLNGLYVHFSATTRFAEAEQSIIQAFAADVSDTQRLRLFDSERIAPFANIEISKGVRKRHGLSNYKDSKVSPNSAKGMSASESLLIRLDNQSQPKEIPVPPYATSPINRIESQIITLKDREKSYLRIPSRSKYAFPSLDSDLKVTHRGQLLDARWKVNGHRSGTIRLGIKVMREIGTTGNSVWLEVIENRAKIVE